LPTIFIDIIFVGIINILKEIISSIESLLNVNRSDIGEYLGLHRSELSHHSSQRRNIKIDRISALLILDGVAHRADEINQLQGTKNTDNVPIENNTFLTALADHEARIQLLKSRLTAMNIRYNAASHALRRLTFAHQREDLFSPLQKIWMNNNIQKQKNIIEENGEIQQQMLMVKLSGLEAEAATLRKIAGLPELKELKSATIMLHEEPKENNNASE
jgi:hypothetical protein